MSPYCTRSMPLSTVAVHFTVLTVRVLDCMHASCTYAFVSVTQTVMTVVLDKFECFFDILYFVEYSIHKKDHIIVKQYYKYIDIFQAF